MDFKVFIASSLRLKEDREHVTNAVNRINQEQQNSGLSFSVFDYVHDDKIVQQLEQDDAQIPINRFLHQSMVFVMIVRGRIGKLTVEEFCTAAKAFEVGRFPRHIFIYYDEDHSQDNIEDDKTISFPKFESDYINHTQINPISLDPINHKEIYYIPFNDTDKLIENQVYENITNLLRSGYIPFPGSIQPWAVDTSDFYSDNATADQNRREKCFKDIYYVRKGVDNELANCLSEKKILFIQGATLSGKTRAAMNLISHLDEGWVTFFPSPSCSDRSNQTYLLMKNFLCYCENHPNHPMHYLFIDDIHDLNFVSEDDDKEQTEMDKTLNRFCNLLTNENSRVKLITTSTDNVSNTILSSLSNSNTFACVKIPEMNPKEFQQAIDFFHDLNLNYENKEAYKYKAIGAILLNLDSIKALYAGFCQHKKVEVQAIRKSLLRAIKAVSIWKRRNLGNLDNIKELTRFFVSECVACDGLEEAKIEQYINQSIDCLTKEKSGITKVSKDVIWIQEYVFNYILTPYYITPNDPNIEESETYTEEYEKKLVEDILKFSRKQGLPLLKQVYKLGSRTQYRQSISKWLYEQFKDVVITSEEDYAYLSRIYANAMIACPDYESAVAIYNTSKEHIRTLDLFTALLRKVQKQQDFDSLRKMEDYNRYVDKEHNIEALSSLIQLRLLSFEQTLPYFNDHKAQCKYTPQQIARTRHTLLTSPLTEIEDQDLRRYIITMEKNIDALAWKVGKQEDWETIKQLLNELYYYKLVDVESLKALADGTESVDNIRNALTEIEYLSFMPVTWLSLRVDKLFDKNNIESASDYLKKILDTDVKKVLDSKILSEQHVINTVSYLVNVLIKYYRNYSFDDRMKHLFLPAYNHIHPTTNKKLIFINCYAYQHMLLTDKEDKPIDINRVVTLLFEFLQEHLSDPDNPIILNNEILSVAISAVSKSKRKDKRSILNRIKTIFSLANVKKNHVVYNQLISISDTKKEAKRYLSEMIADRYPADKFTAINLCKVCKTLPERLGLVGLAELPINIPNNFCVKSIIPDFNEKWREALQNEQQYWYRVFESEVTTDVEREVMNECFNWLKENKTDLLKDGYIYNIIIKNSSYMQKMEDVWSFIKEVSSDCFPDSGTYYKLLQRLAVLKNNKNNEIEQLNQLIKHVLQQKFLSLTEVCTTRIQLYSNFTEKLPMLLWSIDENKQLRFEDKTKEMNLEEYLSTYQRLLTSLQLENKIELYQTLKSIEGFDSKEELIRKFIRFEKKNDVFTQFKDNKLTIEDAFKQLDWTHPSSTIDAANQLLDQWAKQRKRGNLPEDAFIRVIKLYDEYIIQAPRSEIYATLLKFAHNQEEVKVVVRKFKDAQKTCRFLSLDAHFLTVQLQLANNLEDLRQYIDGFRSLGGTVELTHLASMVAYMNKFIDRENPDEESRDLMNNLCLYTFKQESTENKNLPKPFTGFLSHEEMRADILIRLIAYLNKNEFHLIDYDTVLSVIKQKFLPLILSDITNKEEIRWYEINNTRLTYDTLTAILQDKTLTIPESIDTQILQTAIKGTQNLTDYTKLILAFRERGCKNIADVTEPLLLKYRQALWKLEDKDKQTARQLYSRIIVMSKLNHLYYRDYIPNISDIGDSKDIDFDKQNVYNIVKQVTKKDNGDPMSLNDWLRYAVQNLDKPYLLALRCIYMQHSQPNLKWTDQDKRLIQKWEKEYADLINKGDIPFNEIQQCADVWYCSNWKPGVEIVAAIFCYYRKLSNNEDIQIAQQAKTYYNDINKSILYFKDKEIPTYSFNLHSLGYLTEEKRKNHRYVIVPKKEFFRLTYTTN